jgi:hypothetical protein
LLRRRWEKGDELILFLIDYEMVTHNLTTVVFFFTGPNSPSDEYPPEPYSAASQRFDK